MISDYHLLCCQEGLGEVRKKHQCANCSLIKMHKELIYTFDRDSDPCASHFSLIIPTAYTTLIDGPQRPTHSVKRTLTLSLEPTLGHSSTKQPQGVELVFSGQSKSVNRTSRPLFNPPDIQSTYRKYYSQKFCHWVSVPRRLSKYKIYLKHDFFATYS